jgi:hypothetical protein
MQLTSPCTATLLSESSSAVQPSTFRAHSAHLGLLFNLCEGGQEDEAADVTGSVGSVRGASQCRRSMCRKAQVGWVLPKIARQPVGLKKQLYMGAARWLCSGHRWLHVCSGASRTGQKRRPATQSEGSRPAPATESHRRASLWRLWPAAMTPRLAGVRAEDVVASHRAADGAVPSIEGARTHAYATPRGVVAVSRAFGSGQMRHSLRGLAQPVIRLSRSRASVRRAPLPSQYM